MLDDTIPDRSGRAPGPSVQDLLGQERGEVPAELRRSSAVALGTQPIAKERYTSAAFAQRERDAMWSRIWQMACREEDIPAAGDYEVYEIGEVSLLVVRTADGEVRAYHNVCLHRGRLLRETSGSARDFRCPFHGFAWNLDGTCKHITSAWDFQHIDKDAFSLPEAKVGRWGGFVFVNLADDPEPLEQYLEDLPEVYATRGWALENRVKTVHVLKEHPCNWKVALEAFIESFHVVATHPSAMPYIGDAYTQYDVWPDRKHYSRMISPRGLHSPHLRPLSDIEVFRSGIRGMVPDAANAELPEGLTPRQAMGDVRRAFLGKAYDFDTTGLSDSEVLDTIQYHLFPNLVCWAGWGSFIVYRFRPHGDNPDRCLMDIMMLEPRRDGHTAGVVKPTRLGVDQSHHDAPQLGGYCAVFDEDSDNLGAIQRGLKAMKSTGITLGAYQEMRIRFFHEVLDRYLEAR